MASAIFRTACYLDNANNLFAGLLRTIVVQAEVVHHHPVFCHGAGLGHTHQQAVVCDMEDQAVLVVACLEVGN